MVLLKFANRYCNALVGTISILLVWGCTAFAADQTTIDSLAILYNNLGVVRALNEDCIEAKAYFDSALMLRAEDASVYNNLGNLYLCCGSIDEAIINYQRSYALDSLDKRKLFNWSVALYMADSVDESVSKMQEFWEYAISQPGEDEFVSAVLEEIAVQKGDAKKISRAEIKKLMEKAKSKRNQALKKKKETLQKKKVSTEPKVDKSAKKKKGTTPAGEKSIESIGISSLLYWIIL